MEARELEIKEKWGSIKSQPDEDLKQIAKDLYNGLIYTDRHCSEHEIMSRFMCLMFMGPQAPSKPKQPSQNTDLQGSRDNVIYDIVDKDAEQVKYEEDLKWLEVEEKYYKEQKLTSIGLIYEYISQAGPRGMNGGPMFMSMRLLNREDTSKMFDYYNQYKDIREKADNF